MIAMPKIISESRSGATRVGFLSLFSGLFLLAGVSVSLALDPLPVNRPTDAYPSYQEIVSKCRQSFDGVDSKNFDTDYYSIWTNQDAKLCTVAVRSLVPIKASCDDTVSSYEQCLQGILEHVLGVPLAHEELRKLGDCGIGEGECKTALSYRTPNNDDPSKCLYRISGVIYPHRIPDYLLLGTDFFVTKACMELK